MNSPRPISIVGGGLAGLSLGLALRRSGIPTTIYEAGDYPRHRVCGEFIAGLRAQTIATLGLETFLADALRHRVVQWHRRDRPIRRQTLTRPALALSRHALDLRLADAFVKAGGDLRTRMRIETQDTEPGTVLSSGRIRTNSEWIGLKVHARGLTLKSDLEFHLGSNAYVGICAVENGWANVCGLFKKRSGLQSSRSTALSSYLEAAGLDRLAGDLRKADCDDESYCAVAGFGFGPPDLRRTDRLCLGDAFAMIPPFTGNGMAIAFQSAETALPHLLAWSRGEAEWNETLRVTTKALHVRFGRRLYIASKLHPFLLSPARQAMFNLANRTGLLPLREISSAIHAQ